MRLLLVIWCLAFYTLTWPSCLTGGWILRISQSVACLVSQWTSKFVGFDLVWLVGLTGFQGRALRYVTQKQWFSVCPFSAPSCWSCTTCWLITTSRTRSRRKLLHQLHHGTFYFCDWTTSDPATCVEWPLSVQELCVCVCVCVCVCACVCVCGSSF